MTVLLEQLTIPHKGLVELKLDRSSLIEVPAEQAQHTVNRWLLLEAGNMLIAGPSILVIGNSIVWRVPILLTATHVGIVGPVGEVDVDVQSGLIETNPKKIAELRQRAIELGQHLPSYSPRTEVPTQFLPKHLAAIQPN